MTHESEADRIRTGWWVFGGLAVLTGIEFAVSRVAASALPYLIVTAISKAGLIVVYFMHAAQLLRRAGDPE